MRRWMRARLIQKPCNSICQNSKPVKCFGTEGRVIFPPLLPLKEGPIFHLWVEPTGMGFNCYWLVLRNVRGSGDNCPFNRCLQSVIYSLLKRQLFRIRQFEGWWTNIVKGGPLIDYQSTPLNNWKSHGQYFKWCLHNNLKFRFLVGIGL